MSKRRPVISLRYVLSPVSGRLPSALSILYFDTRILATPIVVCRRLYVCNAQSRVPLSVPPLEAYIREALHHYYPILLRSSVIIFPIPRSPPTHTILQYLSLSSTSRTLSLVHSHP